MQFLEKDVSGNLYIASYGYNGRMLLNSITSSLANYVQSTTYDSAGRMETRLLGNNLTQNFDYYLWNEKVNNVGQGGRLKSLTTGSLQNLNYTYDAAGNIKTIFSNADGILGNA
ncbi:MAG: hypothetical protein AABZ00_17015, partial [Chloroflexota bacterium]